VDLCRPTARKYEKAVVRVLGKHAESIVVDTEACGFECMGVRTAWCGWRSRFLVSCCVCSTYAPRQLAWLISFHLTRCAATVALMTCTVNWVRSMSKSLCLPRLHVAAPGAQYRLAVDVIDFNTAVAPAVQYACAGAVVCDDMKAARCVCAHEYPTYTCAHLSSQAVPFDTAKLAT